GASLAGVVTDPQGAVIAGATVKAYDASGSVAGEARTDASGVYELRSLPEGTMRLEIESTGFSRATIPGVVVSSVRTAQQDARLQIGSTAQTVEVTASPGVIQTSSAEMAAVENSRAAGSGR